MQHYYPFSGNQKKHPFRGIIFAIVATVSGAMATITLKVFPEIPSLQVTALWLSIGSIISLSLNYRHDKNRSVARIVAEKPRYLLLQTVVSTLAALTFIKGVSLLNAPAATFINATIFILSSILIGKIVFGDRLKKMQFLSILGTIAGLGVISYGSFATDSGAGVLLIVSSAFLVALGGLVVKKYFEPEETLALNASRSFLGGSVLLLVALLTQEMAWPSPEIWPVFLSGLILGNVIQYSFLYKAYELEKLEVVSTISALSPFIVLVLAFFFLETTPSLPELAGGSIMVASTVGLIMSNKNLTK